MGVFDDLPDLIAEVLTDLNTEEGLGFNVTLTAVTPGAYDTATGASTNTTATQTVLAFEDRFTRRELDGGSVQTSDVAIGIPAALLDVTLNAGDSLVRGSETFGIVAVLEDAPGAADVLIRLHCRRA